MVIWSKTETGRIEARSRSLVTERAQRNLLLVIDGIKTEEMLLANLAGISAADFTMLQSFGLIAPAPGQAGSSAASRAARAPSASAPRAAEPVALDYAEFTARLTRLISGELGLRGFVLTLAVEKASTIEDLQDVARRTLEQIAQRKGEPAATAARTTLYGR